VLYIIKIKTEIISEKERDLKKIIKKQNKNKKHYIIKTSKRKKTLKTLKT